MYPGHALPSLDERSQRPMARGYRVLKLGRSPRPLVVRAMRRLWLAVGLVVQHLGLELSWVEEELDQPH